MQVTTSLLLAYSAIASAQYSWGDWGAANPCAVSISSISLEFFYSFFQHSCFSSAYPGTSSQWSSHCATQTLLNDCISSACPTLTAVRSSASAAQSAQCSAYSSCSTVQDVCTNAYPWWSGGWSAWGWAGPYHDGLYTVTTDSHTGLTTRTVTSTFSGVVSTATQTATLAAAAVASSITSASKTGATSSPTNAASGLGVNVAGALIGAAVIAMVAM